MIFQDEIEAFAPMCRRGEGFADNLEFESNTNLGTKISGRAVPYNQVIRLQRGLYEEFHNGAFAEQDPLRVRVCLEHEQVVGRVHKLEERSDGLWFEGSISANPALPEAARATAMVEEHLIDELSVGFKTVDGGTEVVHRGENTYYHHNKAQLLEISLVPWGAYGRGATLARAQFEDVTKTILEIKRREAREWVASYKART